MTAGGSARTGELIQFDWPAVEYRVELESFDPVWNAPARKSVVREYARVGVWCKDGRQGNQDAAAVCEKGTATVLARDQARDRWTDGWSSTLLATS